MATVLISCPITFPSLKQLYFKLNGHIVDIIDITLDIIIKTIS